MLKATTPTTVTLSSKGGYFRPAVYHFEFEKEGFSPVNKEVSAGFNGWYMGNIVFGGLIGIVIVDPLTGAMWRLDELVSEVLSPKRKAHP
ncbi:MAG: hypothetical protein M0C28_08815 [Candidatus Moduliflexus flocculans]|nr:hypothetical protein [Candidatus Moduliflexus flocculans]